MCLYLSFVILKQEMVYCCVLELNLGIFLLGFVTFLRPFFLGPKNTAQVRLKG